MSRPKGWAPWSPKPETIELVGQVQSVLREYEAHLPLTVRQIFYRLVGAYGYEKTEKAYSRLGEHLVRARRAGMISFNAIRDDGTKEAGGDWGYGDPEEFWQELLESAGGYRRKITEGQPNRIELWCEAAGMIPMLAKAAQPYGVSVYSTGGFSSVSVTRRIAARADRYDEPTYFLHVGDFDPSGESIFEAMSEDARGFLDDYRKLRPRRVALTEEQVIEHDLPTAPPKASDTRSVNWSGDTCQAEAMPPDLLARIVTEAIEEHFDVELRDEVMRESDQEREQLEVRLAIAMESGDEE